VLLWLIESYLGHTFESNYNVETGNIKRTG
jgi:hypothetical protein